LQFQVTYEVDATTATTITAGNLDGVGIVAGEQTLSVVEIDNVTLSDDNIANYGLANDAGEIVATSQDGEVYTLLDDAYKAQDLSTASYNAAGGVITFADEVISGDVSLTAAANGVLSDVSATASIDVEGLATGDYSVTTTFPAASDIWGDIAVEDTALSVLSTINSVLLDSDGMAVAVSANGTDFYAIEDLDLETLIDTSGTDTFLNAVVQGGADPVMTTGAAVADGDAFSVKADGGIDISTQETASAAITTINDALESVSAERSKLGAVQNRLEHTIKNLDTSSENLQASESRIRDVDMAKEMMEFTKNNILTQAAQAMLAQANQAPQGVLQLLR